MEEYLILATTNEKSMSIIISQLLDNPKIFGFGELFEDKYAKALTYATKKHIKTLELFAYGNYRQYEENKAEYIDFNDKKTTKLKLLSILDVVSKQKVTPYEELFEAIKVNTVKELEDLIIQCISYDLISGKMDQKNKVLIVDYSIGRDLKKEDRSKCVEQLKRLQDSVAKISEKLNKSIKDAILKKDTFVSQEAEYQEKLAEAKRNPKQFKRIDEDDYI